jgi:hypothetical protein
METTIQIEEQPPADFGVPNFPSASINSVTAGYFAALRVPLIAGRFLDERDAANAANSVVVNQAFVRRYFEKEDPSARGSLRTWDLERAGLSPGRLSV